MTAAARRSARILFGLVSWIGGAILTSVVAHHVGQGAGFATLGIAAVCMLWGLEPLRPGRVEKP